MDDMNKGDMKKGNGYALIPLLIFVIFYLGTGIILGKMGYEMSFYLIPAPISIVVAIIAAFFIFKGKFSDNLTTFIHGCGDDNIITMCLIYLLAGAFSSVAGATGGAESVVNLCLSYVPAQFITVGLFLITFFISLATGSSVGSVVTLGPIGVGIAQSAGLNMPIVLGAVIGGAMAGDNLSFISDTTIAATKTQNVESSDKFKMNFAITIPAVIIVTILLLIFARPESAVEMEIGSYQLITIIPYIFVLVSAIAGMNVFIVLTGGTLLAGIIGLFTGSFGLIDFAGTVYEGFTGVTEIFLLSMLTGGLAAMVREEGGIVWIMDKLQKRIKGGQSAELAVAAMVAATDAATANNTVSIVINGPVAKTLSKKYKVDPRRMASILDIFSCLVQGIIPYGAQLLMIAGFTNGLVSPVQITPYVWYSYVVAVIAIASMYFPFAKAKNEWDFEKDMPVEK